MDFWYFLVGGILILFAFIFGFAAGSKKSDYTSTTNLTYNHNMGGVKEESND